MSRVAILPGPVMLGDRTEDGASVRRDRAMTDEERLALLGQVWEAHALAEQSLAAQESVMWQAAVFYYETGTDPAAIAETLQVSLPTFWRRIRPYRAGQE